MLVDLTLKPTQIHQQKSSVTEMLTRMLIHSTGFRLAKKCWIAIGFVTLVFAITHHTNLYRILLVVTNSECFTRTVFMSIEYFNGNIFTYYNWIFLSLKFMP